MVWRRSVISILESCVILKWQCSRDWVRCALLTVVHGFLVVAYLLKCDFIDYLIFLLDCEKEDSPMAQFCKEVQAVLYSTEEGFEVPQENQIPGNEMAAEEEVY